MSNWREHLWVKIVALTIAGVFLFSDITWAARSDFTLYLPPVDAQHNQPNAPRQSDWRDSLKEILQDIKSFIIPEADAREITVSERDKPTNLPAWDERGVWKKPAQAIVPDSVKSVMTSTENSVDNKELTADDTVNDTAKVNNIELLDHNINNIENIKDKDNGLDLIESNSSAEDLADGDSIPFPRTGVSGEFKSLIESAVYCLDEQLKASELGKPEIITEDDLPEQPENIEVAVDDIVDDTVIIADIPLVPAVEVVVPVVVPNEVTEITVTNDLNIVVSETPELPAVEANTNEVELEVSQINLEAAGTEDAIVQEYQETLQNA
ncbi:MAG: hypothetical protein AABY43_00830, partial [Candidatus Omnitrophota bacterium]